jgi:hypothetical protein
MAETRRDPAEEQKITTIEPALAYLRQSHPGQPVELVISLNGKTPQMVLVLRWSLLAGIVRDGVNMLVRSIAPSAWEVMWAKKFDYPERL